MSQLTAEQAAVRKRFERRHWRRRIHAWRWLLIGASLVAIVASSVWLVWFSSYLQLKTVQVEGEEFLTTAEILALADAPVGSQLVSVDLARISDRVSALPAVAQVETVREWPDQVVIRVEERQAVAIVKIGSTLHGFDAKGVVFRDYPQAPEGLPIVTADSAISERALAGAAVVASALPAELRTRVESIVVNSVDNLQLKLRSGASVQWGSSDDSEFKAQVLTGLLKQPGVAYDVSVPAQPTLRRS